MLRVVLLICTHPLAPFLVPQPAARPLYHSPCGCLAALMFNTRLNLHCSYLCRGTVIYYDDNGILLPSAPFQYGYSYRHIFFTFDEKNRRIVRFSREFCIAALDGTKARAAPASLSSPPDACEGISFVMGAFRRDDAPASDASISFSYGINDCESALLTVSVARLDALLEFGPGLALGNDAPLPPAAANASSTKTKPPVGPYKLAGPVLQGKLRSRLGQNAALPKKEKTQARRG